MLLSIPHLNYLVSLDRETTGVTISRPTIAGFISRASRCDGLGWHPETQDQVPSYDNVKVKYS